MVSLTVKYLLFLRLPLFSPEKVHQKERKTKFAKKWPKYVKVSLCNKRHQLEKSTTPPVVVVVTNISYEHQQPSWNALQHSEKMGN